MLQPKFKHFIAKRIFHNPENKDFEYSLIGLDKYDYLIFIRAIYNQITTYKIYQIDWLREHGIDPSSLDIERFIGRYSAALTITEDTPSHEKEFRERLNKATRKHEEDYFAFLLDFVQQNRAYEVKSDYLHSIKTGLFLKTTYHTYETTLFSALFGGKIDMGIATENDSMSISIERLEDTFKFLETTLPSLEKTILKELHQMYVDYRNEIDDFDELSEWEKEFFPEIEKAEEIKEFIGYTFVEFIFEDDQKFIINITGESTWNEEQGFTYFIDQDGGLTFD